MAARISAAAERTLNVLLLFSLATRQVVPRRLPRFLRYGEEVMLLRRAPTTQMTEFLHGLLLNHFAMRELLPRLVRAKGDERLQLLKALSRQGDAAIDVLAEYADYSKHPDEAVRITAVESLGRVEGPTAAALTRVITCDPSKAVRLAVVKVVWRIGGGDAANIIDHAVEDADPDVRKAALDVRKTQQEGYYPEAQFNDWLWIWGS
jgi:hypothetical protein